MVTLEVDSVCSEMNYSRESILLWSEHLSMSKILEPGSALDGSVKHELQREAIGHDLGTGCMACCECSR